MLKLLARRCHQTVVVDQMVVLGDRSRELSKGKDGGRDG